MKRIDTDGTENIAFPDGTKVIVHPNGDRTLLLPSGQKEIHTATFKVNDDFLSKFVIIVINVIMIFELLSSFRNENTLMALSKSYTMMENWKQDTHLEGFELKTMMEKFCTILIQHKII